MKRKVLSVILTGAMVAGLAGTVTVHAEEQKTYNIGISSARSTGCSNTGI